MYTVTETVYVYKKSRLLNLLRVIVSQLRSHVTIQGKIFRHFFAVNSFFFFNQVDKGDKKEKGVCWKKKRREQSCVSLDALLLLLAL